MTKGISLLAVITFSLASGFARSETVNMTAELCGELASAAKSTMTARVMGVEKEKIQESASRNIQLKEIVERAFNYPLGESSIENDAEHIVAFTMSELNRCFDLLK